jgi:antitoxin (DNA-binding transcriptional repressor) of toxin-antitoxin stability system
MLSVSVTELKARLSHYLREVRLGGEVLVLDRGVPVARLVRPGDAVGADADAAWDRLLASGLVRAPSVPEPAGGAIDGGSVTSDATSGRPEAAQAGDQPGWPGTPLEAPIDLAAALDTEREDRV